MSDGIVLLIGRRVYWSTAMLLQVTKASRILGRADLALGEHLALNGEALQAYNRLASNDTAEKTATLIIASPKGLEIRIADSTRTSLASQDHGIKGRSDHLIGKVPPW